MKTLKKNAMGFSLIELIVLIVVIGLAVGGVFLAFSTALQKNPVINPQTTANELASARMDIIIGKRRTATDGFTTVVDPCVSSPPAVCPSVAGYTTSSSISPITIGGDSNYKLIDVIVTGPQNAKAEVKTFVASY